MAGPALAEEPGPGEVPAREAEGSLWDYIEAATGAPPTEEVIEASKELAEERFEEARFIGPDGLPKEPSAAFYADPLASVTQADGRTTAVDPTQFDIPVVINEDVERWITYFTGPGRKYMQRWLERKSRYEPMISAELARQGLPQDLIYLSMIESGLNPYARSYAAAVGLWQFIASTGKMYDLRIDYWVDERQDPEKSTEAALRFLGELHGRFGHWYLAWAAYNTGPARVSRAIKKYGTENFWVLVEKDALHSQTDNYVPKLLAAAIIGKNPDRYGFVVTEPHLPLEYDTIEIDGSVSLGVIARCAGVPDDQVAALNPALLRGATPPGTVTDVRIPAGTEGTFAAAYAELPPEERLTYVRHRVAKGETLAGIAARYGTTVAEISAFNRISNPNRITVGAELVIPAPGTVPPAPLARTRPPEPESAGTVASASGQSKTATPAASSGSSTAVASRPTQHTVRSGENLAGIAARYGVSTSDLLDWNNLSNPHRIYVGQKIKVHASRSTGGAAPASASTSRPAGTVQVTYTVRPGDTLSVVASKHGVKVADLQRWNGISNASHVQVGQKLLIHTPTVSWTTYTVRSGDSLGAIATRHGCSVDDLMGWNQLSNSRIYPGQKLRIRAG